MPTTVGYSQPPSQIAAASVTSAHYNSSKQAVPCIFFTKGQCLKGDRCPFLHGPSTVTNNVSQGPAATNVSEPSTLKKAFGGLEKCSQGQKIPQANIIPKSADLLSQAKAQAKVETAPLENGCAIGRQVPSLSGLDDHPPRYMVTSVPPTNVNSVSRSNSVQQVHASDRVILRSRDTDEFSREPSPGFDVLVDDKLRDSNYFHNENHFGRTRSRDGKGLNPMNDYAVGHSADYDTTINVDQDMYGDPRGHNLHECLQGQYAREHPRVSSERMLEASSHLERRRRPRADIPDQIDESDLRYHLSKQRRVNGIRSVISQDHAQDNHSGDRNYHQPSQGDAQHFLPKESVVSNRFRGRIKLPRRSSSPVNGCDLDAERELERSRKWDQLSPRRLHISSHQGRLGDRIKGRVEEFNDIGGRGFRGQGMRNSINDNELDFAGPKSLAELKGGKNAEGKQILNEQQSPSLGKQIYPKLESRQQFESDLSFEGPKPLNEILRRKKAAEIAVPRSEIISDDKGNAKMKEEEDCLKTAADLQATEGRYGLTPGEETIEGDGQPPLLQRNVSEIGTEEGMIDDDAMVDHEPETLDERDGESDYEQAGNGEDSDNLEEADRNAEAEEYMDDDEDDGDDFAKKIGVMFS